LPTPSASTPERSWLRRIARDAEADDEIALMFASELSLPLVGRAVAAELLPQAPLSQCHWTCRVPVLALFRSSKIILTCAVRRRSLQKVKRYRWRHTAERADGDLKTEWEKKYGDDKTHRAQDSAHCPQDRTKGGAHCPQDGTQDGAHCPQDGTLCPQDWT
jgi:hypothetical protein